ncbi:DapH/DapD/GlmU-related protein [Actinomadura luteofluorescens]|uniref:DapH/DapD/GlmU-related protein n=1 Tax=Actinomadura luteofluorescens TaxID=46163 RepID=UPI0036322C0F
MAENVWIGAGATILPGVSIGRDSVVAAGAVVADDVPPSSLVTGGKADLNRQW